MPQCASCNTPFVGSRPTAIYCSPRCKGRAKAARKRLTPAGRESERARARRRLATPAGRARLAAHSARKRGAVVVCEFDPLDVFERDGWRCRICGEDVDRDLRFPDVECATLDHVRSIASGGEHVVENAQLAHFRCNREKWAA